MSISDVIARHGPWRILTFVFSVVLYLGIHAARVPFVLVTRFLTVALSGLDQRVSASLSEGVSRDVR